MSIIVLYIISFCLWKENSCYSILILFFSLNRIRRWQDPIFTRVLPISLSHLLQNSRQKTKNKHNENGLTYLHKHSNNGLNFNVCVGIFNFVQSFARSNSPSYISTSILYNIAHALKIKFRGKPRRWVFNVRYLNIKILI